jgi:hypothetical protein
MQFQSTNFPLGPEVFNLANKAYSHWLLCMLRHKLDKQTNLVCLERDV